MKHLTRLLLAVIVMASACTSKSAEAYKAAQNLTKVVILDTHQDVDITPGYYKYKVKFIKYDVVDYVRDRRLYDQNDTILTVDKYYNHQIR